MDINVNFNQSNFPIFLSKLQELSQIDDIVKIKIENEKMLMYSAKSTEAGATLALKSFTLDTKSIFEKYDYDETFDIVILGSGKFVKNLKFLSPDKKISMKISSRKKEEVMHVRSINISNGKLKISLVGGELHKVRDININQLESRLNPKNAKYGFKISNTDFNDIKKLSSIYSDEKVINMEVRDNKVYISELGRWELEVDEIDYKNSNLIFGKKYLSNVSTEEEYINFSVFESFILIKTKDSNFMMSFEQTFDDEE
ncbi:hypothetical protein EBU94_04415 [bacterium]|nr:hypothetical protein [bacterium]